MLLLNTSLKLGEMGNVVTLIGENNLGKSSIIAAFKKYGENSLNKTDDIYDNEFEEKLDPELTLIVRDGDNEFYHDKSISVQDDVNGYSYKLANPSSDYDQQSFEILKSLEDIFSKLEVYGRNSYYNNIQNFLIYVKELSDVDALIKCNPSKCSEIKNTLSYIKDYVGGNNPDIAKKIEENGISFDNVIEYLRLKEQGFAGEFKRAFFNLYDFNFEPKILQYKQKERLSDSHLTVNWNYDVNSIVGVVLNYLGYSK